ncbi:cold shock domain-containing protein, partial [Kocuria kalidii]|uniref:cold shock domain-containing protein n=1 Tax=Kocuria kalidii TaxID=3376283 RepID=UPI0037973A27
MRAPCTSELLDREDGSKDVFARFSAINSGGYRSLEENQRVEFETQDGPKGPQA